MVGGSGTPCRAYCVRSKLFLLWSSLNNQQGDNGIGFVGYPHSRGLRTRGHVDVKNPGTRLVQGRYLDSSPGRDCSFGHVVPWFEVSLL